MKKFTLLVATFILVVLTAQAQVTRNMVVVEIGTGTWCTYCPGAAMGADDLVSNGHRAAIVENHNGDTYANAYSNARNSYYAISGYPTANFDGKNPSVGGSHTASMYTTYLPKYNAAIAVPSPVKIEYTMTNTGQQAVFDFVITKVGALPTNNPVFHFVVTQSEITQAWQGQTHLNFVTRLMIPDQNGTPLDFSTSNVQNVHIVANIDPLWPMEDIEFVGFVQSVAEKTIHNTMRPLISNFKAVSPTTVCQNSSIEFENSSVGRPAQITYYFPGGTPSTATGYENVTITYPVAGSYDVKMITKTGLDSDTVLKTNYVTIMPGAVTTTPTGLTLVCTNNVNQTTTYTTTCPAASSYEWELYPTTAGTITNNGLTCTVLWKNNWNGIASIRVRGTNDCGVGEWTDYVDITCTSCVGVDKVDAASPVSVYPNPASNNMNISINSGTSEILKVKMLNALGNVVYSSSVSTSGKLNHAINVGKLSEGIYFLTDEGKNLNYSHKITVQH